METGRFIRLLRETIGITGIELAARAGISRVALGSIESGKATLRLTTLEAIAGGLNLTTLQLFQLYAEYEKFEKGVRVAAGITEGGGDE